MHNTAANTTNETGTAAVRDELPDITRPDARLVLTGEWSVDTPARQHAAAAAAIRQWDQQPLPHGMLSHSSFVGSDGGTVLHYSQWTDDRGPRELTHTDPQEPAHGIEQPLPGVNNQHGTVRHRPHRSHVRHIQHQVPGCIVTVSVEFDDPEMRQQWVDTVLTALAEDTEQQPGLIAAHFHLSLDGKRVLNYAEWTSEAAHIAAIGGFGRGSIGSSPKWQQVKSFRGMTDGGFKRYHLHRSISTPPQRESA